VPQIQVDSVVRLKADVPEHELSRGDEGVVMTVWLSPRELSCEVEFRRTDGGPAVRALLRAAQVEVVG
jgi:hypothetical protein